MNVSVRTIFTAFEAAGSLKDLDVVRLLRTVEDDDGREVPAGSEGTIVSVYAEGAAFLVEFNEPIETLATVNVEDLALAFTA